MRQIFEQSLQFLPHDYNAQIELIYAPSGDDLTPLLNRLNF